MRPRSKNREPGFTLLEMMIVLLIVAIASSLALATISSVESAARPERAAREVVAALRYARMLAMTTGKNHGVLIDLTNKAFSVYRIDIVSNTPQYTTVNQPLAGSGTYLISLAGQKELTGTTMSTTPNDGSGLTRYSYGPYGSAVTAGTVRCTYAGRTRTVTIPAVGDPTIDGLKNN